MKKYCEGCGDEVTDADYECVGSCKIYMCGCKESNRILSEAWRELEDRARDEAEQDHFKRYW